LCKFFIFNIAQRKSGETQRSAEFLFFALMIFPNLLLIAGTGNKSGKTTLACRAIEQFRGSGIMGIKITPHFHETTPGLIGLVEKKGYSIFEETNPGTGKYTSRMLKAGAAKVFFSKVTDDNLLNAFTEIMKYIPEGTPVVCESPALRYYIEPGLFIIMAAFESNNNKDINKLLQLHHVMIQLKDLPGIQTLPFDFRNGKWMKKE
jgi:hypothetical protein